MSDDLAAPRGGSSLIRLEDVEFRYHGGDFRLRVPALAIGAGSIAALVGPSGSGKTTLLSLIAGILPPDRGAIETAGTRIDLLPDAARRDLRARRIGLIFQEFELLEYLTVLDNILLPFHLNRSLRSMPDVPGRAAGLAEKVGMGDKLRRHPDRLSHGERQRVAVCRALLPLPRILLADEPTGNLDPANAARVLDTLFDYARDSGATFLMVTHDQSLLPRFARTIDMQRFLL
ncbi:MAG TPA: ABC transporter ATP-binding protein [Candidatus Polarisedimenticolia bacterium]|nr:ABC transporter ATP-binding protein [Candidatus Polarisedimenticolia bacterium]